MVTWLLFGYVGLLPVLLFVLVCGDRPKFEGTWLERAHNFVFGGGCFDSLQGVIGKVCGQRGQNACASVESYCCERPNPFLQIFYLAIVGGTYFSISTTSLRYIPGFYIGGWHRPARSKHCSICNRCIARSDHHCGWMNNCIGEKNLRYFLGFLIWHALLCWYGVYILGVILLGEIHDRNVMRTVTYYYGTVSREIYPQILQWLLIFYSAQVLMIIFLFVVSILLVSFSMYHVYLVVKNTTTNETYKWDDYRRWQAEMALSKIEAEQSRKSAEERIRAANKPVRKGGLLGLFRRSHSKLPPKPKPSSFKNNNLYNRGVMVNLAEVIWPMSSRTKIPPSRRTKKD